MENAKKKGIPDGVSVDYDKIVDGDLDLYVNLDVVDVYKLKDWLYSVQIHRKSLRSLLRNVEDDE